MDEPPTVPRDFWTSPEMRDALRSRHIGRVIRAYRHHPHHRHQVPQERVAEWVGLTQAQVSRLESGKPVVDLQKLTFWAQLLGIPEEELWFSLPRPSPSTADLGVSADGRPPVIPASPNEAPTDFEDLDLISERRVLAAESNVDEAQLLYLEDSVRDLIEENERKPPSHLVQRVRELRLRVEQLLDGRQPPRERERLYAVAAHLSGLLGVVALDLGYFGHATTYGAEAFAFADAVRMPDLQAWVRAGQSLIAYYAGQYHDALAYARDGLRRAPRGPQTVRLTLNGEARALARLGDVDGVDDAVGRGLLALSGRSGEAVSPSLALEPYCEARAAANAATAYLLLGRPDPVVVHAGRAVAAFDRVELRGPQALSRLDIATAELQRPDADVDLEYACSLATEALAITMSQDYESVNQRAAEFLVGARRWSQHGEVRHVAGLLRQRGQRALSPMPSTP